MFTGSSEFTPWTPHPNKLEKSNQAPNKPIPPYINSHLNLNSLLQFHRHLSHKLSKSLWGRTLCYESCFCVSTVCMYKKSHAYSSDPKNRMFPGLWSQEEEVHVSVTVCMCAQKEREREGGGEGRQRGGRKRGLGGLSSPAYRSTKDNLTLPLGLLPRLPTWHSFYFSTSPLLSVNLSISLSLSLSLCQIGAENFKK